MEPEEVIGGGGEENMITTEVHCEYTLKNNDRVYFGPLQCLIKQIRLNMIREFKITSGRILFYERKQLFQAIATNQSLTSMTLQDVKFVGVKQKQLFDEISTVLIMNPNIRYIKEKLLSDVYENNNGDPSTFEQFRLLMAKTSLQTYSFTTLLEVQTEELSQLVDTVKRSCTRDFNIVIRSDITNPTVKQLIVLTQYLKHPLFDTVLALLHKKMSIPEQLLKGMIVILFHRMSQDIH